MQQTPALQTLAPKTLGLIPDDLLENMIAEAEDTNLQDLCQVPGPYFRLLILPALLELKDWRAQGRAPIPRERSLTLVQENRG